MSIFVWRKRRIFRNEGRRLVQGYLDRNLLYTLWEEADGTICIVGTGMGLYTPTMPDAKLAALADAKSRWLQR